METLKPKMIQLVDTDKDLVVAFGCVLPDGQLAIDWHNDYRSHGTYPSMDSFEKIQGKLPNRKIEVYEASHEDRCFGTDMYAFHLERDEDVTQVSGTGTVAVGYRMPSSFCVMQWLGEIPSTFWYRSLQTLKDIHSHNGKTRVVVDDEVRS